MMQPKERKPPMPALRRKLPEEDKSRPEALREAIAEGDADLVAGRFRTYQAGDQVREIRDALTGDSP